MARSRSIWAVTSSSWGHPGPAESTTRALVPGDLETGGPHFDNGIEETHRSRFVAGGDVDLRAVDGIDLGIRHRLGVEARGGSFAKRFIAKRAGAAQAGLDDPAGNFAGPETGYPYLARQATQYTVEGFINFRFVYFDSETNLVALLGRGCGSHTSK